MLVGELGSGVMVFALGKGGEFLSRNESTGLLIGIGVIVMVIVTSLIYRRMRARRNPLPQIDGCSQCESMSVNHRAGLAVCMDCGYSVRLTEVTTE